ncbi:thiamine pyrophosphate-binding protein [Pseudovibrio exalbescens]|uniref:thiamine pyrophosphate-binding protein n=1 Tax=Pseudovibrio exalbescens TaxID=197461 RepID=UPI000C9D237E|nr:thiamine pyrophosphate-binding protein [Pseudovibrio exalbescens]
MRGADLIASKLALSGARYAFGIPGGEVLALMDALDKAGIRFSLVKHENAGGFMAEGSWHAMATNGEDAPAILLATIGPGVANAVNTVANAFQDKVPLIFLSGCVDSVDAQTYTHQVFNHKELLAPVVKGSFRATTGALNVIMDKAISLALSGQPGPVHIDVPISVAEMETQEAIQPSHLPSAVRSTPDCTVIRDVVGRLANAKRPLAIAGVDAVNAGAGDTVRTLCEKMGLPLITTYKGKGLMDESHPLSLGGAGLSPKADHILLPEVAAADLVLLIGYDPIEMRINWRNPWPETTEVIDISPVERTHGMHRVNCSVIGDIKAILCALAQACTELTERQPELALQQVQRNLNEAFAPEPSGWGPASVIHCLRRVMPQTTVTTADSGAHRILASQIWRCPAPRHMLQSSALCTMACALPLAAGFKMASPETPVLVFVGDAGLEMGLGELATLRDAGLAVILCVLVDRSLSLIELKQRKSQHPNLGVDFEETDFPALAHAFGGHGVWIEDTDTLAREATAALKRDTFTILACRIDRRAYDDLL